MPKSSSGQFSEPLFESRWLRRTVRFQVREMRRVIGAELAHMAALPRGSHWENFTPIKEARVAENELLDGVQRALTESSPKSDDPWWRRLGATVVLRSEPLRNRASAWISRYPMLDPRVIHSGTLATSLLSSEVAQARIRSALGGESLYDSTLATLLDPRRLTANAKRWNVLETYLNDLSHSAGGESFAPLTARAAQIAENSTDTARTAREGTAITQNITLATMAQQRSRQGQSPT